MAKRIVVWTETAAKQRREILKYWVNRNGTTTYAEKLIKLTSEQINLIQSNPKLCDNLIDNRYKSYLTN